MIEIAGGIILAVVGLSLLGTLLSCVGHSGSSYTPPPPDPVPWKDAPVREKLTVVLFFGFWGFWGALVVWAGICWLLGW